LVFARLSATADAAASLLEDIKQSPLRPSQVQCSLATDQAAHRQSAAGKPHLVGPLHMRLCDFALNFFFASRGASAFWVSV